MLVEFLGFSGFQWISGILLEFSGFYWIATIFWTFKQSSSWTFEGYLWDFSLDATVLSLFCFFFGLSSNFLDFLDGSIFGFLWDFFERYCIILGFLGISCIFFWIFGMLDFERLGNLFGFLEYFEVFWKFWDFGDLSRIFFFSDLPLAGLPCFFKLLGFRFIFT